MNRQLTCLIIDDDDLAGRLLEDYVQKTPGLKALRICENALEASDFLQHTTVDLLLLDIQMPYINGIQFLEGMQHKPAVIITTSSPHFAVDGFRLNVSDYLLKPFLYERFQEAIRKVKEHLLLKELIRKPEIPSDHIFVRSDLRMVKILFDDIFYIEGWKQYIKIHQADKFVLTLESMRNMEKILPIHQFVRIHKSFIINKHKIEHYKQQHVSIKNKILPVGKTYLKSFQNSF